MTKREVIERLSREELMRVRCDGHIIEFIDGNKIFYDNTYHSLPNVYGVYYDPEINKYEFFVTNNERGGMIEHYSDHDTEDEAYTALYKYIDRENRIYNKN